MNIPAKDFRGFFVGSFCALTPIIDSRQSAPLDGKPLNPGRETERTKSSGALCCVYELGGVD